jgi:hypothetical protein
MRHTSAAPCRGSRPAGNPSPCNVNPKLPAPSAGRKAATPKGAASATPARLCICGKGSPANPPSWSAPGLPLLTWGAGPALGRPSGGPGGCRSADDVANCSAWLAQKVSLIWRPGIPRDVGKRGAWSRASPERTLRAMAMLKSHIAQQNIHPWIRKTFHIDRVGGIHQLCNRHACHSGHGDAAIHICTTYDVRKESCYQIICYASLICSLPSSLADDDFLSDVACIIADSDHVTWPPDRVVAERCVCWPL